MPLISLYIVRMIPIAIIAYTAIFLVFQTITNVDDRTEFQRRVDFLFLICKPRRSAMCINNSTTDFRHIVPAVVPIAEFGIITADDMPRSRLLIVSYHYTAVAHNNIIYNIYIVSARGR